MALYPVPSEDDRIERPAETLPFNAPRALTASASRLNLSRRSEAESVRQRSAVAAGWQNAAWQCYDNVGEVSYSYNYAASVLSRVRFHAGVIIQHDAAPVEIADAIQIKTDDLGSTDGVVNGVDPRLAQLAVKHMRDLAPNGTASMVRAYALNLQVTGECYLACIDDRWEIKSTSELRIDASGSPLLQPSLSTASLTPRRLRRGTPIGRIWAASPRFSSDAESSLQKVLFECEELILLARLARVTARSRLNAGLLFVPDELTAAARTVGDQNANPDTVDEDGDDFEKELFQSMTSPVSAEDSAAAVVPMLVRGPATAGAEIKWTSMARDIGTEIAARTKEVLNRVLQGINAPKELATGISQSRYSNAKLIDEQTYKALVEPLALVFCDAVTAIYLRPLLRADIAAKKYAWMDEIEDLPLQVARIVCWYDPSEVVTSVDQSTAANDGWDRGILSDSAWLKAHGFNDSDKPSEKEMATRLAMKQVAVPPNVIQALIQVALPEIFKQAQAMSQQVTGTPTPPALANVLGQGAGSGDASVAPSPQVPAVSVPSDAVAPVA